MISGRYLPSDDAALTHVKRREMHHRDAAPCIGPFWKGGSFSFNDRVGTVSVGHLHLIKMTGFVNLDDATKSLYGGTFCHD